VRSLSLCTGYGGLDIAVESLLGAHVVAYAEIDEVASTVADAHWSGVPNIGDIRSVKRWPAADIITAGYPCQPFSFAGDRLGEDDPRHLWPHILEAIRSVGPRLVFLENVVGHLSLGFDMVQDDLAQAGYDVEWQTKKAYTIGACHNRNRLWIVASRSGEPFDLPAQITTPTWPDGYSYIKLLPTPTAQSHARNRTAERAQDSTVSPGTTLTDAVWMDGEWGYYMPALNRHAEVLGRQWPAPSVAGRFGQPAVSELFVEWMMMLPRGWVTDFGLHRGHVATMLGNGVVPPQAHESFRQLLVRIAEKKPSPGKDRLRRLLEERHR